jgi:hypothetical protein
MLNGNTVYIQGDREEYVVLLLVYLMAVFQIQRLFSLVYEYE